MSRFILAALVVLGSVAPGRTQDAPRVRLAVVVVFDQLRGDYIERWWDLYGNDGFKRLARDGAWFSNCHYPYSGTYTGAGHASLVTGCSPHVHGIVGNDWYDRALGEIVNCSRSIRVKDVTLRQKEAPKPGTVEKGSGSPHYLISPTLADALKDATGGKGKVVALSLKDRSAVLPGGKKPDACYWMDDAGDFITSTYYRDGPHTWVAAFNKEHTVDQWLGKTWEKLRQDLDYAKHSGPDDVEGEGKGSSQGRTFPHPFGKEKKLGREYYYAVNTSPFGNDVLLDLTRKAVVAEKLGEDDVPDLLCVSFSSNDLVGHVWGPDSQEVLDMTLRSDEVVRDLLSFLDEKVGKGRYVVALSADHGVSPLPEVARGRGHGGGRIDTKALWRKTEEFLTEKYGEREYYCIDAVTSHDFYLNRTWMKARKLQPERVRRELAAWVKAQPYVQTAYTADELENGKDELKTMVWRSHFPERGGDVVMVLKPNYVVWSPLSLGTSHGSPHEYDTHVPLMVLGPGVKAAVRKERASPLSLAPVVAKALGIKAPADTDAPVPAGLFEW